MGGGPGLNPSLSPKYKKMIKITSASIVKDNSDLKRPSLETSRDDVKEWHPGFKPTETTKMPEDIARHGAPKQTPSP
ncbi:hypothetical protein EC991_004794 [Linnemannia zychae]|nr:hypothetical protein EC991_004794 [Linnemannia zychae]